MSPSHSSVHMPLCAHLENDSKALYAVEIQARRMAREWMSDDGDHSNAYKYSFNVD